jgi:hypothetical protein
VHSVRQPILDELLLTSRDAAPIVGTTPLTIRRWAKSGRLRIYARTLSRISLFRKEDVLKAAGLQSPAATDESGQQIEERSAVCQ